MTMHKNATTCPLCGSTRRPMMQKHPKDWRRQAARPLAAHLAFVHQIPHGRELVFILGSGTEADNHDALRHWVEEQIATIDRWPLPAEEVSDLIDELDRALGHVLAGIQTGWQ